ncbi:MAG TPA: hypothetical protein DHW54_01995 [Gemmatimonadetes bacterium]|nr:hypothetical protein [Gemmatimonadota bacterium]
MCIARLALVCIATLNMSGNVQAEPATQDSPVLGPMSNLKSLSILIENLGKAEGVDGLTEHHLSTIVELKLRLVRIWKRDAVLKSDRTDSRST